MPIFDSHFSQRFAGYDIEIGSVGFVRKNYTEFSLNLFKPVKPVGEQVGVIPCAVILDYWRLIAFEYCLMAKLTE